MIRSVVTLVTLVTLAGCAGSTDIIVSEGVDPTRDFEVATPQVDTDWPIGLDTDFVDTDVDTDSDTSDTDTDGGGDTDTDAG